MAETPKPITILIFMVLIFLPGFICPSEAQCLSRDTIISRGQAWLKANVSYSQTAFYEKYRTDCSGFVSMCWGLAAPGPSTKQLKYYSIEIKKEDLKMGDAVLCPSHAMIFFKWIDEANKLKFISLEEASSKLGTVSRNVTYPFWATPGCYPIRAKNVCP